MCEGSGPVDGADKPNGRIAWQSRCCGGQNCGCEALWGVIDGVCRSGLVELWSIHCLGASMPAGHAAMLQGHCRAAVGQHDASLLLCFVVVAAVNDQKPMVVYVGNVHVEEGGTGWIRLASAQHGCYNVSLS